MKTTKTFTREMIDKIYPGYEIEGISAYFHKKDGWTSRIGVIPFRDGFAARFIELAGASGDITHVQLSLNPNNGPEERPRRRYAFPDFAVSELLK